MEYILEKEVAESDHDLALCAKDQHACTRHTQCLNVSSAQVLARLQGRYHHLS